MAAASPLVFDSARYAGLGSAGEREMHIFAWLSELDAHLEEAAPAGLAEELKHEQERLERVLLELAGIPTGVQARSGKRSWLGGGGGGGGKDTAAAAAAAAAAGRVVEQVPKATRA
ncbi:hypothetical protein IWQ57_003944, partial [Coemansia nantahalensis]